jgi:hypothetical protein
MFLFDKDSIKSLQQAQNLLKAGMGQQCFQHIRSVRNHKVRFI